MGEKNIDQALVERVQQGDKSAFDILVLKYQSKIIQLVNRYVHDPDEAMDVAQEAFIKAYRAIGRFRGDSAFYTWIYRIAINTAKNHLVASGRRPPAGDIDAQDAEQYEGATGLREYATPERMILRDEIEKTVASAIEELPDDLKTEVSLRIAGLDKIQAGLIDEIEHIFENIMKKRNASAFQKIGGRQPLFKLKVADDKGSPRTVMIKDLQIDPARRIQFPALM